MCSFAWSHCPQLLQNKQPVNSLPGKHLLGQRMSFTASVLYVLKTRKSLIFAELTTEDRPSIFLNRLYCHILM